MKHNTWRIEKIPIEIIPNDEILNTNIQENIKLDDYPNLPDPSLAIARPYTKGSTFFRA